MLDIHILSKISHVIFHPLSCPTLMDYFDFTGFLWNAFLELDTNVNRNVDDDFSFRHIKNYMMIRYSHWRHDSGKIKYEDVTNKIMDDFHNANWEAKLSVIDKFSDDKIRITENLDF